MKLVNEAIIIKAFEELTNNGNHFATAFKESILNYALKWGEGGLWILGYLLTREGHDDINQRLKRRTL